MGRRVVSGLAVDDDGRQHQARGPATSYQPVPGVAPLCETYSNPAMSLGGICIYIHDEFSLIHHYETEADWENPVTWQNVLELGIVRLTPASIRPREL